MSFPVYEHRIVVTSEGVSPAGPLDAGVYGDERAARITFDVSALDNAAAYRYRVEVVDGAGGYDITPLLSVAGGAVAWDIPAGWTAAGTATLRLVQLAVDEWGSETARRYFPPVLLNFGYRDEGSGERIVAPVWQETLTRAEVALEEATEAAESASLAAETATEAATTADTLARTSAADAALAAAAAVDARAAAQNAVKDATAAGAGYAVRAETAATRAELAEDSCQDTLEQVEELSGIAEDIRELTGEGEGVWHPCVTVDTALDVNSGNPIANSTVDIALHQLSRDVEAALSEKANAADTMRVYKTLGELGLTAGSETIDGIFAAMAANSMLICTVGASNAAIYPNQYVMLEVLKSWNDRATFRCTQKLNAAVWVGSYSLDSGWSGWKQLTDSDAVDRAIAQHEHWASAIPCNAGGYSTVEDALASLCALVGDLRNRVSSLEDRLVGSGW